MLSSGGYMVIQAQNCERLCSCKKKHEDIQLVVLTGGPGAGKTAVLEFVRKILCEHIVILPEAASILFNGGFWRLETTTARQAVQRAIYYVQREMEMLVKDEKKWALGLCDRGALDGLAYWPGSETDFFSALDTTMEKEYQKYKVVIQLQSPSIEMGYNHRNPIRVESAEMAQKIDQKIHDIWKNHPNYHEIPSTSDFSEKVFQAAKLIRTYIPECCR